MKPVTYGDVRKEFKLDDEVWACAFKPTVDKEGKHNYSKPVRGRLVTDNSELKDLDRRKNGYSHINYFVPYKKNGVDLAWSKAVSIYARYFCRTKKESTDFYNELIQSHIKWLEQEADNLRKLLI